MCKEGLKADRRLFCQRTEGLIQRDDAATPLFPIVKVPSENLYLEHLLKGKRLGAELNFVRPMLFGLSPFVLHGENGAVLMKLNDVALSNELQTMRSYGKASGDPHPDTAFTEATMGPLVQHLPFCGKAVFAPFPVKVNEGALPLAIEQVL